MLNWLVEEKQIVPHVPVHDRSKPDDGTFSREEFRYDELTDTYTCPAGKRPRKTGWVNAEDAVFYRSYRSRLIDCSKCHLKPRCSLASRWMCRAELEAGELVAVLSNYQDDWVELHAVYPGGRQPSRKASIFGLFGGSADPRSP
jgi:hypothetical protein